MHAKGGASMRICDRSGSRTTNIYFDIRIGVIRD
jgi:hypothetical protein